MEEAVPPTSRAAGDAAGGATPMGSVHNGTAESIKQGGDAPVTGGSKLDAGSAQPARPAGATSAKRQRDDVETSAVAGALPQRKRVALGVESSAAADTAIFPAEAAAAADEAVADSADDVEMEEPCVEDSMEVVAGVFEALSDEDKRKHEEFCQQLTEKQQVDVFCVRTKMWLPAKIELVGEETTGYKVHFMGWNSSCDEIIGKDELSRLAPRATRATKEWVTHDEKLEKKRLKQKERQAALLAAAQARAEENTLGQEAAENELATAFVEAGLTRSGRKITKRISNGLPKTPAKPAKKKPSAARVAKYEDDLCGACGEIEDEEGSDVVFCDGGCLKPYHFACVGLESAPTGEKWLCEQCRTNEQLCFVCGRNGTIGEKGGVFLCCVPSCGKFYHQSCVNANKLSRRPGKPKGFDPASLEFNASFRCPHHMCSVCEGARTAHEIMSCLKCPEAYHPHCVPPSARYNTIGLLCSKHPDQPLPKITASVLADLDDGPVTRDSSLYLPELFLPKHEPKINKPEDCHHFRLLSTILDDVQKQPPTYRKLGRSIYTFKQSKVSLEDDPVCVCKVACGDDCINRLSFTECFGPAPTPGMKFNKHNRESNCMLGEKCGNRALHQKIYPQFKKFHTAEKGWGLRVLEPVKAGQLVIEYVGEVINEEEKERRLLDHAKNSPEDKNMYIMELGKGEYIDARFKGSVSRFINHSCDPNCHLLKWRVRGVNRIAITALKDIEAGTELSYDYQFHTRQAMEWKCHCKSKKCRGTMAPEKINQANGHGSPAKKLTKKEKLKLRKRAMMQERIQQEKEAKSTARRLAATEQVCMGNRSSGDKMVVCTGPVPREVQWAKYYRLFLERNVLAGFDFTRRLRLIEERAQKKREAKKELLSVSGSTTAASSQTASPVKEVESTPIVQE